MGLKDGIAFQQIALAVQSGGLQGMAGAQHHAQSGHGSGLLLLPSHLYWSLRGKGTLGKLGTVWVMGQQVEPGLGTENRGSQKTGWMPRVETWRAGVGRALEWLGFPEVDRR